MHTITLNKKNLKIKRLYKFTCIMKTHNKSFKYIKLPLLLIIPYMILVTIVELLFRFINYNFLKSNEHFHLIFNKNIENTFQILQMNFINPLAL